MLSIHTLGELKVTCDNQEIPLPPSKKTRALLVYLLLTQRPHRRDRLCELLWDETDDPRGALRWSLSKLRSVIDNEVNPFLTADRERVELLTTHIKIDIRLIEEELEKHVLDMNGLIDMASKLSQPLLDGADLPNHHQFQNWLTYEREQSNKLYLKVLKRLTSCADLPPIDKLHWCKVWLEANPYSVAAGQSLLGALNQFGYDEEARSLSKILKERFAKARIAWSSTPVADTNDELKESSLDLSQQLLKRQKIQFCSTPDNVRLAYATVGEGPPLVKAANWLSHLELDWDAPIWSPLFRELAQDHRFIRYDERGNGLSDWNVDEISLNSFVADLETIVDALKLDKFPLLGISQGAAVSIEYAVKHPQRVSCLILFGAYASGWRVDASPEVIKEREAVMTLTETGWGQDNPAYRQIFSSTFMPGGNTEDLNWFNEFQRQTTSPENAVRFQSAFGDIDVRDQLAKVTVPTLVIHSSGDRRIPVNSGREIAASIENAEFVCLDSDNHLLIGQEPASAQFVQAVRQFIKQNQ
jgi:pimeloyl-ACP methyl ester carboxylesterase